MEIKGKIYLCGTPIGNLEDITFRLVNVLNNVDFILCEDTRNTIKILNHLNISKPLYSYHSYNENNKSDFFIHQVLEGKNIALVSDAGMPIISDPGFPLVKKAIESDIELIPISGPSAFLLNLIVSGFSCNRFMFIGFLPNENSKKLKILNEIKNLNSTIIIYEAPHRIEKTLDFILNILGDRNICIGKEITKKYENFWRGKISEFKNNYPKDKIKGEFSIVIEGFTNEIDNISTEKIDEEIEVLKSKNLTKKEISKIIAKKFNLSSKEIYNNKLH